MAMQVGAVQGDAMPPRSSRRASRALGVPCALARMHYHVTFIVPGTAGVESGRTCVRGPHVPCRLRARQPLPVRVCVCLCVCVRARARARVCMCALARMCMCSCTRVRVQHAHTPAFLMHALRGLARASLALWRTPRALHGQLRASRRPMWSLQQAARPRPLARAPRRAGAAARTPTPSRGSSRSTRRASTARRQAPCATGKARRRATAATRYEVRVGGVSLCSCVRVGVRVHVCACGCGCACANPTFAIVRARARAHLRPHLAPGPGLIHPRCVPLEHGLLLALVEHAIAHRPVPGALVAETVVVHVLTHQARALVDR